MKLSYDLCFQVRCGDRNYANLFRIDAELKCPVDRGVRD